MTHSSCEKDSHSRSRKHASSDSQLQEKVYGNRNALETSWKKPVSVRENSPRTYPTYAPRCSAQSIISYSMRFV